MPVEAIAAAPLVGAVTGLYGLALASSAPGAIMKKDRLVSIGLYLFLAAFAANTAVIADLWIEAGRPPFKTMYETLLFYPWCVALVTIAMVYLYRLKVLVPFSAAMAGVGLVWALAKPDLEILNLPPALQSGWFVPHVVTYFISYAGLFASFILAGMALVRPNWSLKDDDADASPDQGKRNFAYFAHQAATFGIVTLTLGLVMGAIWGKVAWGDYWSWDPKENWALVTWLAYMIYLHLRLTGKYQEKQAMWVLVIAFGAVMFTYLGINILPTAKESMHAYQ